MSRLALLLSLLSANTAVAQSIQNTAICAMTADQANKSSLCVRYYFTCQATDVPSKGAGMYAYISAKDRERMMLSTVLVIAERNCREFSYAEALAAMRAKMFSYEGAGNP